MNKKRGIMKRKVLGILFVSTVFMTSWCGCGNGNTKAEMQTGEKGYQKIELVMAVNGTDIQIDTKVADKFAELVAKVFLIWKMNVAGMA